MFGEHPFVVRVESLRQAGRGQRLAPCLERLRQAGGDLGLRGELVLLHVLTVGLRDVEQQLLALAEVGGGSGQLKHLEGAYLQDWLLAPGSTNWRVDPALGGESRVFADVGIHWCDLMEFVTGHRITRLRARFSNLYADRPTEDTAEVEFETDRGATGGVVVSQVAEGHSNDLSFSFQTADAGPGATPLAFNEFDSADYQPSFDRFMVDAYASFAGWVATGSDVGVETGLASAKLPTFADGRRAASLIDAVVRSARTGEWVVPL